MSSNTLEGAATQEAFASSRAAEQSTWNNLSHEPANTLLSHPHRWDKGEHACHIKKRSQLLTSALPTAGVASSHPSLRDRARPKGP